MAKKTAIDNLFETNHKRLERCCAVSIQLHAWHSDVEGTLRATQEIGECCLLTTMIGFRTGIIIRERGSTATQTHLDQVLVSDSITIKQV
jgi:hypothetical protein